MGVVRHAVKTSAGRSGFCGSISWALHAASRMHSCMGFSMLGPAFGAKLVVALKASASCDSHPIFVNGSTLEPGWDQSAQISACLGYKGGPPCH